MIEQNPTSEDGDRNGSNMVQVSPKAMRLRISKPQHQTVIQSVATQLGSNKPIDGLEHILNCWLVGNIPPATSVSKTPIEPVTDEYSELMEF